MDFHQAVVANFLRPVGFRVNENGFKTREMFLFLVHQQHACISRYNQSNLVGDFKPFTTNKNLLIKKIIDAAL